MSNMKSSRSHLTSRRRAAPSGISLNEVDASVVKGMLARGDAQHAIAAWFGVNGGRIAEIATGDRFADVPIASAGNLPPSGPYVRPQDAAAIRRLLTEALNAIDHEPNQARIAIEHAERLLELSHS